PSLEERERVPHHMIDICEPAEMFTAGDYQRESRRVLEDIRRRGKLPILSGGTGLYLRAVTEGLFNGPTRSLFWRNRLEMMIERKGRPYVHRLLKRLDPEAASRIAERDKRKVIRALEVRLETGKPLSEHLRQKPRQPLKGVHVHFVGVNSPRQELCRRIGVRVSKMCG